MIRIYIPTLKRMNHQTTWDHLPLQVKKNTLLVCPPEEAEQHAKLGRNVLGCSAKGIAPTRDFIIQHANRMKYKAIVMFDDDIIIQKRRDDMRITDCTPEEVVHSLEWLERELATGLAHCGFATRFLGYASPGTVAMASRMMHCLAYNPKMIKKLGLSFALGDPGTFAIDDMYMTLQLLTRGYVNHVSLEWRVRTDGSNAKGGASTWRTAAQQTDNAKRLVAAFPNFVKLREKKAWKGMEADTMFDVTVQWRQAYLKSVRD